MEILDIESRLDAEIRTRNVEFTKTAEKTNRMNLQLSEQMKTVKQSNTDLRIELAQLKIDYGAVQDEVSKIEVNHGTLKDELSELKAQLQIDNDAIKGNFLLLAENVSKITESCDCIMKTSPNDVTLQTSTLIMQERDTTTPVPVPTSCKDKQTSGVYNISFENSVKSPTSVYCDADTVGGGWIVILRRQNGSVNFNTSWTEYKNGFGDVNGEFWIGNDFFYQLTKTKPMELRVDMEEKDGNKVFAKYAVFKVGSEADKYVLTVSGYCGTAGDALDSGSGYETHRHNGMKFSTLDQDNDRYKSLNCAGHFGGGRWYNACYLTLLTGTSSTGETRSSWSDGRSGIGLKFVEMKIR